MASIAEVHIDRPLTEVSVMYRNNAYHHERFFTPFPVPVVSNKYFVYRKEDMLSAGGLAYDGKPRAKRAPGALAMESVIGMSQDSYLAEEYAHREFLPDALKRNADNPLALDIDVTIQLTEKLMLDKELYASRILCDANNYPSNAKKTLTYGSTTMGEATWANYASNYSDPFYDFGLASSAIAQNCLRRPNNMLLTLTAEFVLANHPKMLDRYKYTSSEGRTISGLPPVLYGMNVWVADTQYNTAEEGQTFSQGTMWRTSAGKDVCICWWNNPDQAGVRSLHFGKKFSAPDQTTGVPGQQARRYRDDARKGEWIEVADTFDFKMIAVDGSGDTLAGYIFVDVSATS